MESDAILSKLFSKQGSTHPFDDLLHMVVNGMLFLSLLSEAKLSPPERIICNNLITCTATIANTIH
jgi:hypothetical protein